MADILVNDKVIGTLGLDGKVKYNDGASTVIKEMIAGQSGGSKGKAGSFGSVRVSYRWDRSRIANNDNYYTTWKSNPLMKNRVRQVNSLVFGRGFKYSYDKASKDIIDRFWRVNRIRSKLNALCTDAQLFGEIFIGLFPQSTGDTLIATYESNQVEIDFDPSNVSIINRYIVSYKNEETNKDEQFDMMPIDTYLNNIEFTNSIVSNAVRKVRKALGLNGTSGIKGKGVMLHLKFNNSTTEIRGTSDFAQVLPVLSKYMDYVGDRLSIHQLYGSPAYDITIDTDDDQVILNRIEELSGFTIGSNPVHNKKEEWKPLEFKNSSSDVEHDEKTLRGLLSAGMSMPEHLLFNQSSNIDTGDGTFALNKMAEDMQDVFGEALTDIHKFAVAVAGGDPATIDDGQLIFPEISTMSEKTKAETYVLKVGANICSRKTAAMNTGHNWDIEEQQMLYEMELFTPLTDTQEGAGRIGGRQSSRLNNQDPNRDDGSNDRKARGNASNISTQVMGGRKTNN